MAPMNRFKHSYPGLPPEQRQAIVEEYLRPWLVLLNDWQSRIKPASYGAWFPIDEAKQALNKMAESLTGEPLWRPGIHHSTGDLTRGRTDET